MLELTIRDDCGPQFLERAGGFLGPRRFAVGAVVLVNPLTRIGEGKGSTHMFVLKEDGCAVLIGAFQA
jgi:hypothetical protein